MIISDLTQQEIQEYQKYLGENYIHYWKQYTEGPLICVYLISVATVEKLFGIPVEKQYVMNRRMALNGYSPNFDAIGKYMIVEEFKNYAANHGLCQRRVYTDLLAAYRLVRYNKYSGTDLCLCRSEMYDAVQLHQTFSDSVIDHLVQIGTLTEHHPGINISIDDPTLSGITYKCLLDYLHYGNPNKPIVRFIVSDGNKSIKCTMNPSDYDTSYDGANYTITIKDINIG